MRQPIVNITNDILKRIAELDEFKGTWKAIGNIASERLEALKKVATIESIWVVHTDRRCQAYGSGDRSASVRD